MTSGVAPSERPAEGAVAAALHRPFLDLHPPVDGPLFSWGPVLAWSALEQDAAVPGMQRVLSTNFRINLLRQVDGRGFALHRPQEIEESRCTPQWSRFCSLLARAGSSPEAMATENGVRLVQLCLYLGFHRYVYELLPAPSPTDCSSSPEMAALAYQRAFARRMLHQESMKAYDPCDMELVASRAERRVRFYAASAMVVHHAKLTGDVAAAARFRSTMDDYLSVLRRDDSLESRLDQSRYWRCVSFVPFLCGDQGEVDKELSRAESLARGLVRHTQPGSAQRLAALDNLHAVLESRMREALWLGDVALALARIDEVAAFDPWDAKVQIELGEVLLRAGDPGRALGAFQAATRYGPPGTATAHYLAGCCYEQMEMDDAALDEFLAAAALDPWGISTAGRVQATAIRVGAHPIARWARKWADRLAAGSVPARDAGPSLGNGGSAT